ncbi:LuxR C-terminal-related transcriptional regulator, partial [Nonomuraea sp. NPDC055795]
FGGPVDVLGMSSGGSLALQLAADHPEAVRRVVRVSEFVAALRTVAAGGTVMDPEVVAQLMSGRERRIDALTAREREVLTLMAQGRGNADIGARLTITGSAVHKHIGNIFTKLGLPPEEGGHRRVLAVLAFLGGER